MSEILADAIARYAGAVEISGTFEGNPVTYVVSLQGEGSLDATQEDRAMKQIASPDRKVANIREETARRP